MNQAQEKKIIDREQEIIFTNYTGEDFEGRWNKKVYRLKAGRSYYLPFYLAEHFGKHLVDRELNKMATAKIKDIRAIDPRIDQREVDRQEQAIYHDVALRQELMDRCVVVTNPAAVDHATPEEVPLREIPLKTNIRSADMVASGKVAPGDLGPSNQPKESLEGGDESNFEGLKGESPQP